MKSSGVGAFWFTFVDPLTKAVRSTRSRTKWQAGLLLMVQASVIISDYATLSIEFGALRCPKSTLVGGQFGWVVLTPFGLTYGEQQCSHQPRAEWFLSRRCQI